MDFSLTADQSDIVEMVRKSCARFDDAYWMERDESGLFPEDFFRAVAQQGLLGIAMPPEYGGAGMGITEAALMMQAIAESGAGMSGASSIHMNIFGLQPVVVFGTDAQRERMLPPLIRGEDKACFAVTEPDAGLNTLAIKTRAERRGDQYFLTGQKIWISTAQVATKVLVLARTTPLDQAKKRSDGLSLFYTTLDRKNAEIREIKKMGRHAVDSNIVFFDSMPIPAEDLIGQEGQGFKQILHGMNPERILIAAEAVGLGRAALRRASEYAVSRRVFNRQIGQNQGIQHPLAKCWVALETANLMVMKAAALYDRKQECGLEANAAKYSAAEAAFAACETAIMTHGGMGYAKDYHVERFMRECFIPRIAPVSPQMVLNFIAERALGLPRSY